MPYHHHFFCWKRTVQKYSIEGPVYYRPMRIKSVILIKWWCFVVDRDKRNSPVVKWHFFTQACFAVWTMLMIDSGSKGCPEQESAWCHFGTLGRNLLRAKTKWPPNISRSNMIFQLMEPGTSVIPHFYVILTEQSISCIILMSQGHLQGQKDNFKVKEAKIQFLTNKDRNMCNTSFKWDFIRKWMYGIILLIQG